MSRNPPAIPAAQNLLDRAIAYFAPGLALRRFQQRGVLALTGGYTGARIDRAQLAAWRTRAGSPETDLIADLPTLRERSRDLARNAPVATGAIGTTVTHVIGTGLSCTPQIDAEFLGLDDAAANAWHKATRRRFKAWAENTDCHLERAVDFYGAQEMVFRSTLESGDTFVITPRIARQGRAPQLALQIIEADRVCNPQGQTNSDTLTEGIEHSPVTGEAVGYHVMRGHPGDLRAKREWSRVAARGDATGRRNVLHLFRPTRPGQRRGAPMLAPIIEPLKQIARYTDAELQAAVTSGLFSVFMRMDPTAFQDIFDEPAQAQVLANAAKWSGEIEAGKVINLLPGEEPVTSNPGRPNAQFDPFTQSILKQIGMALGMPYEVLTMAYQSSYSAARGALLMAWKFFMVHRNWMAVNFCQPVYELWLADEVAAGRIAAPGFFADPVVRHAWCGAQWVGDGPGSIDPTKEVAAARERVALGISTLQAESILHDGVDWETKHGQQVKEHAARKTAGLAVAGEAPPEPTPAEPTEEAVQSRESTAALLGAITCAMQRETAPPQVNVHQAPNTITVHVPEQQVIVQPPAPPRPIQTEVIRDPVTGLIRSVIDRAVND